MNKFERSSGILLHITSLPGRFGVGSLGREAYSFIDWLIVAKQSLWQILPLGHTGYGDSPYQCYSAFAGNPVLIDIDLLIEQGWLSEDDVPDFLPFNDSEVEFGRVNELKWKLVKLAASRFAEHASLAQKASFERFKEANCAWLDDYSFYAAVKHSFDEKPWWEWDYNIRMREHNAVFEYKNRLESQIEMFSILQYFFFSQWYDLKAYANKNGIKIVGDIPLYIAHDSSDAWCRPEIFMFDENRNPSKVAGVPPDYFSETGQLWGNPLYNWDYLKQTGFKWWIDRVKANFNLFDVLRIDHFRGLAAFWAIPFGEPTAVNGVWLSAPGKELLDAIKAEMGAIPLIAEDLGVITPDVEELRDSNMLPGMKILQFAFDSNEGNNFLPHLYPQNSVVYTGTHDNDTVIGWFEAASENDKRFVQEYFNADVNDISWSMIKLAWSSVSNIAIAPLQDILSLGSESRMNLPGKPSGYWRWRYKKEALNFDQALRLARITKIYNR